MSADANQCAKLLKDLHEMPREEALTTFLFRAAHQDAGMRWAAKPDAHDLYVLAKALGLLYELSEEDLAHDFEEVYGVAHDAVFEEEEEE